jgi:alkaline phosphatase
MLRGFILVWLALAPMAADAQTAKNVILFLGDAGGLPTLNAAGIYAHDRPLSLFVHSMPHVGLSETSALDNWVTDSAAGMTAIMTGHKTRNGMVSMVPAEGGGFTEPQTLLEMAEQRGLSTGVITNMPIWDATPAVCYAHAQKRSDKASILKQLFAPRQGDGPDFIVGKDRQTFNQVIAPDTQDALFRKLGYQAVNVPADLRPDMTRAIAITDADFDPQPAVEAAIGSLSRNPKGYFLMVEWDMHTDDPVKGLTHGREMDDMIRRVSQIAGKDTLILFVADHSFGLRLRSSKRGQPLAEQVAAMQGPKAPVSVDPTHTGEEVVAAAMGPGAEGIHGFFSNTALFDVMRRALGWAGTERPR